jgi:hypothetical protein
VALALVSLALIAALVIPIMLVVGSLRYWRSQDAFSALADQMVALSALGLALAMLLIPLGLAIGTGQSYVYTATGCFLALSCTWVYMAVSRRVKRSLVVEGTTPKSSIESTPGVI